MKFLRESLKSGGRWLRTGWIWPLALLVLPMCGLDASGVCCLPPDDPEAGDPPPVEVFEPGDEPKTSAIMCDIPKLIDDNPGCATAADLASYSSMSGAALALNLGETFGDTALDYSPAAIAACGGPQRVLVWGTLPEGLVVCLNCEQQIPLKYADATKACLAKCRELNSFGGEIPAAEVDAFCTANARLSTNFAGDPCYDNICTNGGEHDPDAPDPRRHPEDLIWTDIEHAHAEGNSLIFDGPETGDFSGGAASKQLITEGDAWVEFQAGQTGVSHVIGLRASCADISLCPDGDETLADIPLALSLNLDGAVNIVENGAVLAGPFPGYVAGERFRIQAVDRHDGTADISFFRYTFLCVPDSPCPGTAFYTYAGAAHPSYPLRVDATFREVTSGPGGSNASLNNVTIMRIIK